MPTEKQIKKDELTLKESRNLQLFRGKFLYWTAALTVLSLLGACGSGSEKAGKKDGGTISTIRISGAWALYPMMVRWADEFTKTHPGCEIDVAAGGAGKGVADTLSGLVDIGMVSREIKPEELQKGAWYVPVVKDAVFPIMNAGNPVAKEVMSKGLTKKKFLALWVEGKNLTWGQLAGGSSVDRIRVYTRSDACGAAETWAKYLENRKQEDLRGIGVYGDPGITEAIKKDLRGIGYNNLNFAYDMKTGLPREGIRIIPIDINENGRIDPEEDLTSKEKAMQAVIARVYPSPPVRELNLIIKGKPSTPVREFIQWILTDGQRFVEEVGYIRISEKQIKEALAKVKN
jgi:phosphate transport system substrate-binding protein